MRHIGPALVFLLVGTIVFGIFFMLISSIYTFHADEMTCKKLTGFYDCGMSEKLEKSKCLSK